MEQIMKRRASLRHGVAVLGLALVGAGAHAQCLETWTPTQTFSGFPGLNGQAATMWDPDGAGPQQPWVVVAGGSSIPGVGSERIAAWDGTQWRALGTGFAAVVRALHVHNGELYAGGDFFTTGGLQYLARWNGTSWVNVGGVTPNNSVYAITTYNGNLVVSGYFSQVGAVPNTNRVASWNGAAWSGFGTATINNGVESLAVFGTDLIAGGVFTAIGGNPVLRVARWTGSAWTTMGDGFNGAVNALHVHNGELHAGGGFTQSGGNPINYVARWTGSAWQQVGAGLNTTVNVLRTFNGNLLAGGSFSSSGPQSVNRIGQFVSGAWSTLGTGVNSNVNSIAITPANELVIVGGFSLSGTTQLAGLARYNGIDYVGFGNYLSNRVNALTLFNGDLVAGGEFNFTGSQNASRVARLVSSQWQPIGNASFGRSVNALTVFNGQLWAGGDFFIGDGSSTANYASFWNGTTWQPSAGLNGAVSSFAIYNNQLFAGGNFTGNLATWNGTTWVPFTTALRPNTTVNALQVFNGLLYVGGFFTSVASPAIADSAYLMAWNGSAWTSLGLNTTNSNGAVNALTVHNNQLHAGGAFTNFGGITAANRIVRWNNPGFSALGAGTNGTINALTSYNSELVAGGSFTQADGSVGAQAIARWNGAQWRPLGSGMATPPNSVSLTVNALLPTSDGLLRVGGGFAVAGGLPSSAVAAWTGGGGAISITSQPQSQTLCVGQDLNLGVQTSGSGTFTYQWRKDGQPLRDGRGILGTNSPALLISNYQPLDAGVYDVVVSNNCGPLLSAAATITTGQNCPPVCGSIDFNNDGIVNDPTDIEAFLSVYSGGPCF